MGSVRGTGAGQFSGDFLRALRNIDSAQHTLEHGQGCCWLVVWDLVAGFVYSGKGKVAVLSGLAVLLAIQHVCLVAGSSEVCLVGVVECKTDCLTS